MPVFSPEDIKKLLEDESENQSDGSELTVQEAIDLVKNIIIQLYRVDPRHLETIEGFITDLLHKK